MEIAHFENVYDLATQNILSEYPVLLDLQVIGRSKRALINWPNISAMDTVL